MLKKILYVLIGPFVLLQLVPANRENPPVRADLEAPEAVTAILKRSCYDCHSNETHWPWYSYIQPVAWLVAHDVEEGREHLNFSDWGLYSADKRSSKSEECVEQIQAGEMPMSIYVLMHSEAKISPEDLVVLKQWSDGL